MTSNKAKTTTPYIITILILIIGAISTTTAINYMISNPLYFSETQNNTKIYYAGNMLYINNEGNITITKTNQTEYQTLKAGDIYSNNQKVCTGEYVQLPIIKPTILTAGMAYYNTTRQTLCIYNGTAWRMTNLTIC